jgi:hypothetical protein
MEASTTVSVLCENHVPKHQCYDSHEGHQRNASVDREQNHQRTVVFHANTMIPKEAFGQAYIEG